MNSVPRGFWIARSQTGTIWSTFQKKKKSDFWFPFQWFWFRILGGAQEPEFQAGFTLLPRWIWCTKWGRNPRKRWKADSGSLTALFILGVMPEAAPWAPALALLWGNLLFLGQQATDHWAIWPVSFTHTSKPNCQWCFFLASALEQYSGWI